MSPVLENMPIFCNSERSSSQKQKTKQTKNPTNIIHMQCMSKMQLINLTK